MKILSALLGLEDPPKKKKGESQDEQLRRLQLPAPSEAIRKLYESPLADSLYGTSTKPSVLGEMESGWNVRGMYEPRDGGKLHIAGDPDASEIFKHEMGHAFLQKPGNRTQGARYDYPVRPKPDATPLEKQAHSKLDEYGRRGGPEEAHANAFRAAFNFLSQTQRDPVGFREKAGEMESRNPGAGEIVRKLLETDVFKNHQLRPTLSGWPK